MSGNLANLRVARSLSKAKNRSGSSGRVSFIARFAIDSHIAALLLMVAAMLACNTARTTSREGSATPANTYYIDSANGDDARRGDSPAQAWKTLSKVNATSFAPGDRILFKSGGHWSGQLSPKGSGTEQVPIVIGKFGGDALPMIEANGEADEAVLLKNQEYWEIHHLEITN